MKSLFATFSALCLLMTAAPFCCCEEDGERNAAAHSCCGDPQEDAPCEGCPAMQSLEPALLVDALATPTPAGTDLLPAAEPGTETDLPFLADKEGEPLAFPCSPSPPSPDRSILFSIFLI